MSKLTALLVTLSLSGALGALLPGDAGYQYDRPGVGFAGDYGRRVNELSRYPNNNGRFGNYNNPGYGSNLGRFGYNNGYNGYRGDGYRADGYNNGYNGYRADGYYGSGYNGRYGDGSYRGYDDSGKPSRPYNFQYDVRDPVSGSNFGQEEVGDANGSVQGEYRVLLPDSRTQVVRYTADDVNGYVADVRYEGQAQYPTTRPGFLGNGNLANPNYYNPNLGPYQGRGYGSGYGTGYGTGYGLNGLNGLNGYGYGTGVGALGVNGVNGVNGAPANQYLPPNGSFGK